MAYAEIGSMRELRDLLGVPTGRAVTEAAQNPPETRAELEAYYAPANYAKRLDRCPEGQ